MSVVLETTIGDITVDLYLKERPNTCLNFLKLCKIKYYNLCLFTKVQSNFMAQTGDPTGTGRGGESIFCHLYGEQAKYFDSELKPRLKHEKQGTLSMVNNGNNMNGSQFFLTLGDNLTYLDEEHSVFGEVVEGFDVLQKLNESICDPNGRPYQDVRITHTVVIHDPFDDPAELEVPDRSPSPLKDMLETDYIAPDEEIDDTKGKNAQEIEEKLKESEAKAQATILEMVGDIPDVDVKPPENVLFVCKLNPVTSSEDLEMIFQRFGAIVSCEVIKDHKTGESLQYAFIEFENEEDCENAYFKMDNVLIDDRRIHVDFSQSVSKLDWKSGSKQESFKFKGHNFVLKGDRKKSDGYEMIFNVDDSHKMEQKYLLKSKKESSSIKAHKGKDHKSRSFDAKMYRETDFYSKPKHYHSKKPSRESPEIHSRHEKKLSKTQHSKNRSPSPTEAYSKSVHRSSHSSPSSMKHKQNRDGSSETFIKGRTDNKNQDYRKTLRHYYGKNRSPSPVEKYSKRSRKSCSLSPVQLKKSKRYEHSSSGSPFGSSKPKRDKKIHIKDQLIENTSSDRYRRKHKSASPKAENSKSDHRSRLSPVKKRKHGNDSYSESSSSTSPDDNNKKISRKSHTKKLKQKQEKDKIYQHNKYKSTIQEMTTKHKDSESDSDIKGFGDFRERRYSSHERSTSPHQTKHSSRYQSSSHPFDSKKSATYSNTKNLKNRSDSFAKRHSQKVKSQRHTSSYHVSEKNLCQDINKSEDRYVKNNVKKLKDSTSSTDSEPEHNIKNLLKKSKSIIDKTSSSSEDSSNEKNERERNRDSSSDGYYKGRNENKRHLLDTSSRHSSLKKNREKHRH